MAKKLKLVTKPEASTELYEQWLARTDAAVEAEFTERRKLFGPIQVEPPAKSTKQTRQEILDKLFVSVGRALMNAVVLDQERREEEEND